MSNPVLVDPSVITVLQASVVANVCFLGFFAWFFMLIMPPEAKYLTIAKMKRSGAILLKMDSSGSWGFENVEADKNEGVLIGKDSRTKSGKMYYFLHKVIQYKDSIPGKEHLTEAYNDILKYRGIMPGIKKPVYVASTATHIASTPKFIEEAHKAKIAERAESGKKLKLDKKFSDDAPEVEILTPLSVDELNELAGTSWSVEDIKTAEDEGYLIGLGLNPPKVPGWAIPLGAILIIFMLLWLYSKSNINLGMFGM